MDGRQIPLDKDEFPKRNKIKRKNSAEEKVKQIELEKQAGTGEEKFEKTDQNIPRKSSKDKVLSPRFFVRSASGEKQEKINPPNKSDKVEYKKL